MHELLKASKINKNAFLPFRAQPVPVGAGRVEVGRNEYLRNAVWVQIGQLLVKSGGKKINQILLSFLFVAV